MKRYEIGAALRRLLQGLLLGGFAWSGGTRAPLWAEDFSKQNARTPPAWLRDGVIYEIFPRNFCSAGNLSGITARLDEIKDLGVNIVWLMPIHPMGEKMKKGTFGSPYSVRDYYGINPDYGTKEDFQKLVAEAHKRGLKVIMDLVANHTSWDSVLMEHPEFYKHDVAGKIIPPEKDWTDVAGLNYDNPKLREYMIAMLKYWIDPGTFDVDGFRCDVAFGVPTSFWDEARAELMKVKPDIMMLAEASKPDLLVKAFDCDYSWPLMATLNDVLLKGAPASELKRTWEQSRAQFPRGACHLRMSDNHDEPRAVVRFGLRGAMAASALMFTLDGVPLLYNGMEVGDATGSGDPALFEKMPVFWDGRDHAPMREAYRDLIKLRKEHTAFRNDRVNWLRNSDEGNLVTFMRMEGKEEFVVVINFSNRPEVGSVEVMHEEEFRPVKFAGLPEPPGRGFPMFRLNGFEWRVFQRTVK